MSESAIKMKLPRWLMYSLLTMVLWGVWGAWSKYVSDRTDVNTNQIFFTIGLVPLLAVTARSSRAGKSRNGQVGSIWAFVTGILGGIGNIAFFRALGDGGKVSIVAPTTALFPLVTVLCAVITLHERLHKIQMLGLFMAFVAIYLLSR